MSLSLSSFSLTFFSSAAGGFATASPPTGASATLPPPPPPPPFNKKAKLKVNQKEEDKKLLKGLETKFPSTKTHETLLSS